MLCIKLPPFPVITWDLTYLRQCNTLDHGFLKCSIRSPRAPQEKPRSSASCSFTYVFIFWSLLWGSVNYGQSLHGLHNTKSLRTPASDRNQIFYSFSRLIAIFANKNAHIYAREEQILTIRMIVLEEWVYNVHKNLKMKIMNNTFHAWWHEQQFFGGFYCN